MAEYQATVNDKRVFQLRSNAVVAGELHYTEWYTFKATTTLADGSAFQIVPKGFWGTTIEVKDQENVLFTLKMSWDGNIVIKSRLGTEGQNFAVKSQGVFKQSFVLQNREGMDLLAVKPEYTWNKIMPEYHIFTTDLFEQFDSKHLLLLITVHCINYYMTMVVSTVLMTV